MPSIDKRSFDTPDEVRKFKAHGHLDVVTMEDFVFGKGTFEPGWRWSNDVKPIVGTDSCQVRHTGMCLSGRMAVQHDDGTQVEIGPGDVYVIEPGHDAWIVGEDACVMVGTDFVGYAKPGS